MEQSLIEDFNTFERIPLGNLLTLIEDGRVFHYIFLGIYPIDNNTKMIIVENLYNIDKCKVQKVNYDDDNRKQVWYTGKLDFNTEVVNNHHLIQSKSKLIELKRSLQNANRNTDIIFVRNYETLKKLDNDQVVTVINCRGVNHYTTFKTSDDKFFLAHFNIFKKNGDMIWGKDMWKFNSYNIFRENLGIGLHPAFAYHNVIFKGHYSERDFELLQIRIFQIQNEIAFSLGLNEASDIEFHNLLNSISSNYV